MYIVQSILGIVCADGAVSVPHSSGPQNQSVLLIQHGHWFISHLRITCQVPSSHRM